jgi:hypothetical protein
VQVPGNRLVHDSGNWPVHNGGNRVVHDGGNSASMGRAELCLKPKIGWPKRRKAPPKVLRTSNSGVLLPQNTEKCCN